MPAVGISGTVEGVTKSVKRMFVLAVRAGLGSQNLTRNDPVIGRVKDHVGMEYPIVPEAYPSIWLTASFPSLAWQSMNAELVDDEGRAYNRGEFIVSVSLEIMALSNEERDAISDALANMILFGNLAPDANLFYRFLAEEEYLAVTPTLHEIKLGAESVTIGTPWDDGQLCYTRSLSFQAYGEFAQRLDDLTLVPLRMIDVRFRGQTGPETHFTVGG